MRWLISFSYTAVFYRPDSQSMVGPTDSIMIIEEHPAKFAADMVRDFHKARMKPPNKRSSGGDRGDMLHCIYSAIEIPDGTLTDDEADGLS